MSAATITATTTAAPRTSLESELARHLAERRERTGPHGARPPAARLRPLVDREPRARRPSAHRALAGPPPTLRSRVDVLRAVQHREEVDEHAPQPASPPVTEPVAVAHALAHGVVDALVGRRPIAQLARWLTPGVFDTIRARTAVSVRVLGPARAGRRTTVVRSVRTSPVTATTVEASAVVDDGIRVRAVAMRLEAHRGAWRAVVLEVG